MYPGHHLSYEKEKIRYLKHNNDVNDPGYQRFVDPLVRSVLERFSPSHKGLDFGSGPGPVITKLLRDRDYSIEPYDPFFRDKKDLFKLRYDYVICCEVIEHFRTPAKEFAFLRSILNPEGMLICMTEQYPENADLTKWHYANDPTHVFFYHKKTFGWISEFFGFSSVDINGRVVRFHNG